MHVLAAGVLAAKDVTTGETVVAVGAPTARGRPAATYGYAAADCGEVGGGSAGGCRGGGARRGRPVGLPLGRQGHRWQHLCGDDGDGGKLPYGGGGGWRCAGRAHRPGDDSRCWREGRRGTPGNCKGTGVSNVP